MKFLNAIFGDESTKVLKKYRKIAEEINALEPSISALSDSDLKAKTADFKSRLSGITDSSDLAKKLDEILPEAFAVVREASKRTLGQRHFDVQLIGGMILHSKNIAEMRTGEGKTLVATLPVYLNALTGKGVHVVTVNDYLSRRDAVWMGQIYSFLGLSIGVINHEASYLYDPAHTSATSATPSISSNSISSTGENVKNTENKSVVKSDAQIDPLDATRDEKGYFKVVHEFLRPVNRKDAYGADITYGTNHEFGFDYLRDNLEYSPVALRQRPFYYAVVDEIDSILIDEARTPLIISAASSDSEQLYHSFASLVRSFEKDKDYTVDEKKNSISVTDSGIEKAEKMLGVGNIYTDKGIKYVHHLETAIKAKALYTKDKQYVIKDGQVVIVDEFTGHIQPGRRWSEGLHQAVEAKEGVPVQKETRTYASITYQNYFRLYEKLGGMTGTAMTSSEEFFRVYGLGVVPVPTHREIKRLDHNDSIFRTKQGKLKALATKVKELHLKGQPVLIGTVSIENNEIISAFLKSEGVPHEVLNAKNHEREGEIIAQAGKKGAVTVATNMAGRGVDIKLGGSPVVNENYEEIKNLGGLFVIGTERHEARRIDNQLRGRSGRQGDPGETQFYVSLEDDLMRVFGSETLKSVMGKLNVPEDMPIESKIITKSLESAQTKIEGYHFDARKHVLEFDDVLNQQRKTVYERRRDLLLGDSALVMNKLDELITAARSSKGLDFTDEAETQLRAVIEEKKQKIGTETFCIVVRQIMLQTIDMLWVEHLEVMDHLRGSVNLRAYGQRDPLVEYKKEGLRLFREMQQAVTDHVIRLIPHVGNAVADAEKERLTEVQEEAEGITGQHGSGRTKSIKLGAGQKVIAGPGVATEKKIGRNDLCFCGSGKKYKKCHGKDEK